MAIHRKLLALSMVTRKVFLPDMWLSLSLHEPIHKTLLLLNHRPLLTALNEVLCLESFRKGQRLSILIHAYMHLFPTIHDCKDSLFGPESFFLMKLKVHVATVLMIKASQKQ